MKLKRIISLLVAIILVAALLPGFSTAQVATVTEVGSVYAPDVAQWGAQNNNGWYWMIQDKATGAYSELPFNAGINQFSTEAEYAGGQRVYLSDALVSANEKLVFGFKAPASGTVAFEFDAVAAPESEGNPGRVTMEVLKNGTEGITITGYDASSIVMENDDRLRTYTFTANVSEGDMVYITFACDYLHFLWFGTENPTFSATYTAVGENNGEPAPDAYVGQVFAPDASKWGIQNNNSWYWMIQDKATGAYSELPFNTGINQFSTEAEYAGGQRVYLSDALVSANEKLVFGFKAPATGTVNFEFDAVAAPESADHQGRITMEVLKNGTDGITINGYAASSIEMENDNQLRTYTFTADVKEGDMVYITFACDYLHFLWFGTENPTFSATYTAVGEEGETPEVDPNLGKVFGPDASKWGTQDNNGWYWMLQDKTTGTYTEQPFNTDINQFSAASIYDGQRVSLSDAMVPAGANLVFAFKAPVGGTVNFKFNAVMAPESAEHKGRVTMSVLKNGTEGVNIDGYNVSSIEMENDNAIRTYTFTADVKEGTMIYITFSCDYLHFLWLGTENPTFSAKYVAVNDEKEENVPGDGENADPYAGKVYAPDASKWGTQGNNGFYWMYNIKGSNMMVELPFNRNSQFPNAFSDHMNHEHLHMASDTMYHTAETAGAVIAFKAPVGGVIKVIVTAKGGQPVGTENSKEDVYLTILKNETQVYPASGKITLPRNDQISGIYEVEIEVKAGTMIYAVASCDAARAGAMNMVVTYISSNDAVEEETDARLDKVYEVDYSTEKWGTQNNNGWTFQYFDAAANKLKKLAWSASKNQFVGVSEDANYEHLFIGQYGLCHPAMKGYPAQVFTAPYAGSLEVVVQGRLGDIINSDGTQVYVMLNGKIVDPGYQTNDVIGAKAITLEVKVGDVVAVVMGPVNTIVSDTSIVRAFAQYKAISTEQGEIPNPGDGEINPDTGDSLSMIPATMMALVAMCAVAFVLKRKENAE